MARMLISMFLLSAGFALSAQASVEGPHQVVQRVAGSIADEMDTRKAEFESNPEQLEALVRRDLLPALDMDYSARLILGRTGRDVTPEQLKAFSRAMSELLITRYSTGLLEYRNRDQVEVMPARGALNEKMTRVRTRVRLENGKYIPVDYVFRKKDEQWKAFDVIVEGISYVATYRNQIMPQVQAEGIDAVTARISSGEIDLNE